MRRGETWGTPATGDTGDAGGAGRTDLQVTGGDADLARAVAANPGARVQFHPDPTSDLARALGLATPGPGQMVLPVDALRWSGGLAVNMVVIGTAPDRVRAWTRPRAALVVLDGRPLFDGRATTVVIANGEFLRGRDVVPRGHPGDGRLEVQVYALGARERGLMRRRLPRGVHVPHPRIVTGTGRTVRVDMLGATVEHDGRPSPAWTGGEVAVVPAAVHLLV